jgi:hypothetical protein
MQEGRPLAFTSKQLSERNLGKSIYEKEILAILHLVDLWHPYLLGQRFQINTDHQSLKYFLEQRISSLQQQKWVTKLFGYDYEIIYKKGKENVVADALSCKYEDEGSLFLFPSLYQIGSKMFARNGYKIPKVCSCSNNRSPVLHLPQGTLGSMMSFDTNVIYI